MSVWMYTSKLSWYLAVSFIDLSISSLPYWSSKAISSLINSTIVSSRF
ncbi:hypothetical protein L798_06089 [Zootermopsis nevadensis]|uniref:Uncharacterized protein n=1 Tax=Zootermopsis nevadensis TaxID=136037 RepID=A0A067R9K7_ZOONE|nr:hypothetical protein L798_06089 [Zootermopsis nevadensis]